MSESVPPQETLWRLMRGAMATQALHVVCRFGIADRLAGGPRQIGEVAAEAGADADALYRFLRVLASEGVFAEGPPRVFRNTAASELLRTDGEERWHEFALQFGDDWYRAFAEAPHAARVGEATFPLVFGTTFEQRLQADPQRLALFNRSMEGGATQRIAAVAELPWDAELVVDVGGGTGAMLVELLVRHPRLRGILLDLPAAAAEAAHRIAANGLASRCDVVAGSYFDAVPAGDAYVLSRILHGLDDADAGAVLRNVRAAARPGARVLVLDAVLPEGNEPHGNKWLDLLMLVLSGGRERTAAEWEALFAGSGFRPVQIADGLIEAVPE